MHKRDPQKHSIDMSFKTPVGVHLQLPHSAKTECKQESVSYIIYLKKKKKETQQTELVESTVNDFFMSP